MSKHCSRPQKSIKDNWDSPSDSESEDQSSDASPSPQEPPVPESITSGFLRLPVELRIQIYNLALYPIHTSHIEVPYGAWSRWGRNALTIIHSYPDNGTLLATCRQIHWEAMCHLKLWEMRSHLRILGDASCLDHPVAKGVLQCASKPLAVCKGSSELVSSWQVTGGRAKRIVKSHAELHGILDASFFPTRGGSNELTPPLPESESEHTTRRRRIELAISDPSPLWWANRQTYPGTGLYHDKRIEYWASLLRDIPRFDHWTQSKNMNSKRIKMPLELVIRPALLSEAAARQWHAEQPLKAADASQGSRARGRMFTCRIVRREGLFIEQDEWDREWAQTSRYRELDIATKTTPKGFYAHSPRHDHFNERRPKVAPWHWGYHYSWHWGDRRMGT